MKANETVNIPEILNDRPRVQKALRDAVQKAIRIHKLLGHPIVVWRDGKPSDWRRGTVPRVRR